MEFKTAAVSPGEDNTVRERQMNVGIFFTDTDKKIWDWKVVGKAREGLVNPKEMLGSINLVLGYDGRNTQLSLLDRVR